MVLATKIGLEGRQEVVLASSGHKDWPGRSPGGGSGHKDWPGRLPGSRIRAQFSILVQEIVSIILMSRLAKTLYFLYETQYFDVRMSKTPAHLCQISRKPGIFHTKIDILMARLAKNIYLIAAYMIY